MYDVLYWGTVEARDALVAALSRGSEVNHDVISRSFTYADDGTATEYVTHRTDGEERVFVTKRDIFGRVIGERYNFEPQTAGTNAGADVLHNQITATRHERHLETFSPRHIALVGKDGRFYALDLGSAAFFTLDAEEGRVGAPVTFESPEAWAEVFGGGSIIENGTGLIPQDDFVRFRQVGQLLEDQRPRTAEEIERNRLAAARDAVSEKFHGWDVQWTPDGRAVATSPGKFVRTVTLSYDRESGRFKTIERDNAEEVRESGNDERSALGSDQVTPINQRLVEPTALRKEDPARVTLLEKLSPASPHYDMQLAIAERTKEYERMRQAEAPPPRYPFEHLPNGGSLMTNARRLGERRGVLTVPVVAKRRPTRDERMNALGAMYGAVMQAAKERGLEEAVQKDFVAHYIALSADQDVRERDQAWAQATKADPEIGQQNLERSLAFARYALDRFGDPELYGYLDDSGLGNHPEIIRMFKRAGEAADAGPSVPLPIPKPGWKVR